MMKTKKLQVYVLLLYFLSQFTFIAKGFRFTLDLAYQP